MVLIIPVQFILAIIMALVIQARLKFSTVFLAIFAIPLAASIWPWASSSPPSSRKTAISTASCRRWA